MISATLPLASTHFSWFGVPIIVILESLGGEEQGDVIAACCLLLGLPPLSPAPPSVRPSCDQETAEVALPACRLSVYARRRPSLFPVIAAAVVSALLPSVPPSLPSIYPVTRRPRPPIGWRLPRSLVASRVIPCSKAFALQSPAPAPVSPPPVHTLLPPHSISDPFLTIGS